VQQAVVVGQLQDEGEDILVDRFAQAFAQAREGGVVGGGLGASYY
jgi:hypothetical protein